jgi:hypothetical protein
MTGSTLAPTTPCVVSNQKDLYQMYQTNGRDTSERLDEQFLPRGELLTLGVKLSPIEVKALCSPLCSSKP